MAYRDKPLDNPINWSFKAGRLFDIDIRVHIVFVLCAVVMVWMEIPDRDSGISWSLGQVLINAIVTYLILFGVVLLHEFGHCFGARYTGGEADQILLWPLGGLAFVNPPHNARAHMITTAAGPMVNLGFCLVCAVLLILWMGSLGAVPLNPLYPSRPIDHSLYPTTAQWWLLRFYALNYILLLFNLLPIFLLDGGRLLQAALWSRKGYGRAMETATGTGMIGAIVILLVGLFLEEGWMLMMIAVFGYITCWQSRQMIREQEALGAGAYGAGFEDGYFRSGQDERKTGFFERRRQRRDARKAQREQKREEERQRAVEAALRKVSISGVESLTPRERRILEEETKRQQSAK